MVRVIEDSRQYQATSIQVERLEAAIRAFPTDPSKRPNVAPELQALERDTIQDVVDELRDEMAEYEALRDGTRSGRGASTLAEIPKLLLAAREAADVSLAELAERLDVTEAELREHERTLYISAQYGFMLQVADLLGIRLRGYVDATYPVSAAWRAELEAGLKHAGTDQAHAPLPSDG